MSRTISHIIRQAGADDVTSTTQDTTADNVMHEHILPATATAPVVSEYPVAEAVPELSSAVLLQIIRALAHGPRGHCA